MGKKGPRDLKLKTIPQLKNTLDAIFAKWVKLNWSDGESAGCFTCHKILTLGTIECQAGHFISRAYSPVRYDENNVRIQCSRCNEHYSGRPLEFENNLRLEIGDQAVNELKALALTNWKWERDYLIDKIIYYRQENKEME